MTSLSLFIKPLWIEDYRLILIKIEQFFFFFILRFQSDWNDQSLNCFAISVFGFTASYVRGGFYFMLLVICELLLMDDGHFSVRKSEDICLPQQVDLRLQDVFWCWSSCHSVSCMKIEGYIKGCDKATLAFLCISSFSLDPNLALVRNTCLISQFFSC